MVVLWGTDTGEGDISFFPDYTPSILREGVKDEEERALTDEIEVIRGEVEVLNPRWELVDGEGEDRDYVYIGEKIRLKVDVRNIRKVALLSLIFMI